MKYYSQYAQDKFLDEKIFKGKNNGFFVEIGAHNGIEKSNTYFFEQYRAWKGMCIEPIPNVFAELCKNRPDAININGCIGNTNGRVTFWQIEGYAEMLSGIASNYDPKHLARIEREIATRGGEKREITVECYKLNDILTQHQIEVVDYCSIDVEGSEMIILESIDFRQQIIKVMSVENNYASNEIKKILKGKGNRFVAKLEADEIFELKEVKPFWKFW